MMIVVMLTITIVVVEVVDYGEGYGCSNDEGKEDADGDSKVDCGYDVDDDSGDRNNRDCADDGSVNIHVGDDANCGDSESIGDCDDKVGGGRNNADDGVDINGGSDPDFGHDKTKVERYL